MSDLNHEYVYFIFILLSWKIYQCVEQLYQNILKLMLQNFNYKTYKVSLIKSFKMKYFDLQPLKNIFKHSYKEKR